jgi:hypothetical protein
MSGFAMLFLPSLADAPGGTYRLARLSGGLPGWPDGRPGAHAWL